VKDDPVEIVSIKRLLLMQIENNGLQKRFPADDNYRKSGQPFAENGSKE